MSYAKLLYNLPTTHLREIVHRRASSLRGVPRIQNKRALATFLSEALSHRDSILSALNLTNLLQLRIMTFVIARGGTISFERLVEEAGREAEERLRRSIDDLESSGLLFWVSHEGKRAVHAPPSVCQHTPLPMPLRYRLVTALQQYDPSLVEHIAATLDLPAEGRSNKAGRIQAIAAELTAPERVRSRIECLAPEARDLLDFVLSHGGVTTLYDLAGRLEPRQRNQLFSYDWSRRWGQGKPRNPAEELLSHGLLALAGSVGWGYGEIVVPGDVLEAITGASLFADGAKGIPAWETIPAEEAVLGRHEFLCRDVTYLFGFLGRTEASRTSKGNIHRSTLKTAAKGFTVPTPHYAAFVYVTSRDAGLIDVQGRNELYDITGEGQAWLEQSYSAQLRALYDAWRTHASWYEAAEDPMTDAAQIYYTGDIRAYRDAAITLLSDLARERPGEMASFESLAARARFRWWQRFPPAHGGEGPDAEGEAGVPGGADRASLSLLRRICAESLYWLGLTELRRDTDRTPTHVRLSARGRRLFLHEAGEEVTDGLAETFVVQPNLEIYAPPNLAPRLLYRLFRVTEPTGSGMLMLSRDMLRRALDRGETADGLLRFLRKYSQTGVPQNVEYLIKEVGGRHGHIKIGQAGLYLQVSDPVLLKELKAQKNLKIHFRSQLADTVALITGDSVDAVLRQLRQAGYFPVAADHHEKQPAPPRPRRPQKPVAEVRTPAAEIESRIDWSAVEESGDGEWEPAHPAAASVPTAVALPEGAPADAVSGDEALIQLLRTAAERRECVQICYAPTQRTVSLTVIEPHSVSDWLVKAYSRTLLRDSMFNIRLIRWARPTGETFE